MFAGKKMKWDVMMLVAMVMTSSMTCQATRLQPSASAASLLQYSYLLQGKTIVYRMPSLL